MHGAPGTLHPTDVEIDEVNPDGSGRLVPRSPVATVGEVATGTTVQLGVTSVATGTVGHPGDTQGSGLPETQVRNCSLLNLRRRDSVHHPLVGPR